ncbi:Helix-turn-helix domain-containing protein [Nonomuraea jiangxiensis]|uniref:Helix-turn-helix domain-containing protein n=2 Tax=Nonomuraea jiangxiensis TaxID=633440 RepID=A0A1G8Q5V0_9ACTN|nr:Helix-turn-helix domain-containing protein [Nonomuraea jiangxiensis]
MFSHSDLGRVRFAILPFQETLKAARGLGLPKPPPGLASWRHVSRAALPAVARPVVTLCSAHTWHLPDFLTPQPSADLMSFEDELHAALDDPSAPVQRDTAAFTGVLKTVPVVVDTLLHHPDRGRRTLRQAFTAFHQAVLAPDWPRLHAQLAADVAYRARLMAQHGLDAMLATLCPPHVRWEYPHLTVTGPGAPDFALGGRGLVLVPSMFLTDGVHRQLNDRQQPMLFYPARTAGAYWRDGGGRGWPDGRLAGAIGERKASVLRALADRPGCGTTDLATALGVTPATASTHVANLRRAGLVATTRVARTARHDLTPLGLHLLDAHIG